MGVFAPLLRIAPGLKADLITNYTALVNLTVLGMAQEYLVMLGTEQQRMER